LRAFAALPEVDRARPRLIVSHMIFASTSRCRGRPRTSRAARAGRPNDLAVRNAPTKHHRLHAAVAPASSRSSGMSAVGVPRSTRPDRRWPATRARWGVHGAVLDGARNPTATCPSPAHGAIRRTLVALGAEFGWRNLYYVRLTRLLRPRLQVPIRSALIQERNRFDRALPGCRRAISGRTAADSNFARRLALTGAERRLRPWGRLPTGSKAAVCHAPTVAACRDWGTGGDGGVDPRTVEAWNCGGSPAGVRP
jgi:hypothetical protein